MLIFRVRGKESLVLMIHYPAMGSGEITAPAIRVETSDLLVSVNDM